MFFYRVVNLHPSRLKHLNLAKVMGCRLPERAIAVTQVHAVEASSSELVLSQPDCKELLSQVQILGGFTSADLAHLSTCKPPMYWPLSTLHMPQSMAELARLDMQQGMPLMPHPEASFNIMDQDHQPSVFELLRELKKKSWIWQKLPKSGPRRDSLEAFTAGKPRIMMSSGVTLHQAYLQCLLLAEPSLPHEEPKVKEVPHGQNAETYLALLNGKCWQDLKQAQDTQRAAASHRAVAFHHDGEVPEGSLIEAQAASDVPPNDVDTCDGGEFDLEAAIAAFLEEDEWMFDTESDRASRHEEHGVSEPPGPPETHIAEKPLDIVDYTGAWGIHRIGFKKPSRTLKLGGLEAVCVLHAKSSKTGCKKLFRFDNDDSETKLQVLLQARQWLNKAVDYSRQWEHVFLCQPVWVRPASAAEVEGQVLKELPDNWTLTPDEDFFSAAHQDKPADERGRASNDTGQPGPSQSSQATCTSCFTVRMLSLGVMVLLLMLKIT